MSVELTDLDLFEVSLVDAGDDPLAKVTLLKRKGTSDMSDETLEKQLADANQEIETLKAKITELETITQEVETLKVRVEEFEAAEIEKSKPAEEMIDIDGEMVAKSAVPAPVLKKLEELEKAKEAEELRKRADEKLPNFKGSADQRGKLLKSIGDDAELLELLVAADALFAQLFVEKGKTDAEEDLKDATAKLDTMVKAKQAEGKMTYEQAYLEVSKTKEGLALINQTYKK
jgi:preprotein translocase subunit SecD